MSGLLVGILLSTSLAGLLSNLYGWQLIYIISGVLMMGLAIILKKRLPHIPTVRMAYGKILHSMLQLIRQEKRLVYRALIGASAFAAMSVLFSTIAVLLGSSFGLPDVAVGLVTLIGVFGALSTKKIGKIADRGHGKLITWAGLSLLAVSWSFLYFGAQYLWSYIIGFGLINLGLASVHTSNQNVIFHLRPDAKSRLNAVYMTSYFIGGACGSALGIYAWHHGGWSMSCLVGLTLVLCSACFAWLDQQHLRRQQLA